MTSAMVVVSVVLTGLFAGNELATLTALHPEEWRALRSRWERLHVARVVLDLLAFACLIAALEQTGP